MLVIIGLKKREVRKKKNESWDFFIYILLKKIDKSYHNSQLWIRLVIEARSDAVRSNIA